MGAKELRAAFNGVAEPAYTASTAMLQYEPDHSQILTFSGRGADGSAFTHRSRKIRPNEDVNIVAAETAQALLDQDRPA